ncbi:cyanophycin synthetase [Flavobacterium sp.]|uniref:cyanophycin synthetase n=1 Tax=Flavobacterium sp. TaxID=239 RepID=UPI002625795A|nr:cyanophycin synthetase [Flavobacterium sp.]
MKIRKIQVLRGPNVWSNYRKKLIQMRLDLEELEHYPTDRIPGFRDRLQKLIPSLVEHHCSEGKRGGFFLRVELGTWMGHVIEHIALEIQTIAGMDVGYGRTRSTNEEGVYNVVFAYTDEEAGLYAAHAAVRIAEAVISNEEYDLYADINNMKEICESNCLGPSTKSIVEEAVKRGIPFIRLGNDSMVQLGYGANQMRFQATMTCKTSALAVDLACDKQRTKELLGNAAIPVPKGELCSNETELEETISAIGYPLVIKPLDGNQGKGATINITDRDKAREAFEHAKQYSRKVMVERYINGFDFRILVIDNKYVAAAKRIPAHVTGNGHNSIQTLIDLVNFDTRRGNGHENVLTKIKVDHDTEVMLEKAGYTLETVLGKNEVVYLKSTANLSTGGSSVDVTEDIHPDNIALAERIARIIGLDICGIDIMAQSLSEPITENSGAILEVNAAPGFRMHLAPTQGKPRNVAAPVVDMLFPQGKTGRIPVISITGTNGKTTTTRLTAHIAQNSGFTTGFTTTDGIYVNNKLMMEGDTTGPASAQYILKDPSVEFAVLETARGGILRSGIAFDQCDIGIITNIKEDHLGLNDIHNLEDLARVKSVVVHSVKKDGWAILNADDEHCLAIAEDLKCNVAYFTLEPESETVKQLISNGKIIAFVENGYITVKKDGKDIRIANVHNVPLTHGGKIKFMVANTLASALATYLWGFSVKQISSALQTFTPGYELTPGRMNLFELRSYHVMVDYAHNPHGYEAIEDYIKNIGARKKIGIVSGIGDRRDEDIIECAFIAARMFDHIIIRQEGDLRGNTEEHINDMMLQGLQKAGRNVTHEIISDEEQALRHALLIAEEGDFITAFAEDINLVVSIIKEQQAKEDKERLQHTA